MRMRKVLAGTALALVMGGVAYGDDITLTATVDGLLVDTINSGGLPTLDVNNVAFGSAFNLNSLTINSQGALAPPAILSTNTLDVDHNGGSAHVLVLDIISTGLTGPGALANLLSEFSVTGLTAGWTVQEQTFINGGLLASTPVFGGNNATTDSTNAANVTNPFTAEVKYTLDASATAGQFNGGIDLAFASGAPGPSLASGLPGIVMAGFLGWLWLRRRLSFSLMP